MRKRAWPELLAEVARAPDSFTPWLREILAQRRALIENWVEAHCNG